MSMTFVVKLKSLLPIIVLPFIFGCSNAIKEMTEGTEGRYALEKSLDKSGISDRFELVHVLRNNPHSSFPVFAITDRRDGQYIEKYPRHIKPAFEFSANRDRKGYPLLNGAKMKVGIDNPDQKLSSCQQPTIQFFEREPMPNVGELNYKFKVEFLDEGKANLKELAEYKGRRPLNKISSDKLMLDYPKGLTSA